MATKRPHTKKPAKKAPPQQSRRSSSNGGKGGKSGNSGGGARSGRRLAVLLLVAALLLAGLIWLARREEQHPPVPPKSPEKARVEARVDQSAAAREQIEAFLAASGVPAEAITREPANLPHHYEVRHRRPAAEAVEKLRLRLRQVAPPLELSIPEDGVMVIADRQGKALLTIQYLPVPAPPPKAAVPPGKRGRVAIIVDDLGRGLQVAKQLLAISQPVTFSILPGEPHAAEVAGMARAAGREVLLHAPMEPQGYPVVDPGDDALLVGQSDEELRSRLQGLLEHVPHAVGTNNHMGSRFTEDERAMDAVMAVLRERGMFFVDSLTSGSSVAAEAARRAGVPVLRRDVFLDNVAEIGPITKEIRRLADKARRNGFAVGICHPYPETIQALRQELPKLAGQGIEFVTVSELLRGGG